MSAQPTHLAERASYTGNRCRTPWDNVAFPERSDPLTEELDEVTCKACRAWLIKEGQCPECGEYALRWSAGPVKLNTVADGRLTMRDVETQFYLGCESCSETLITGVSADQVLPLMNSRRWRP